MVSPFSARYFRYVPKTVLIIEDNENLRENTAELLGIHQYNVLAAPNGTLGFSLARSKRPDVILCDMVMPTTDAYGFIKMARKDPVVSTIPVVFFSAGTISAEKQRELIQSASGFVKKPFSQEELLSKLEAALKGGTHPA